MSKWGIQFDMLQDPMSAGYQSGGFNKGDASQAAGRTAVYAKRRGLKTRNSAAYRAHTPQLRGSHNAGRGALAEVALVASVQCYKASLRHRLWSGIDKQSNDIAKAIKTYGGVAICGRIYMMDTPNVDAGVTSAYFHDVYLMDAGPNVGSVFPAAAAQFIGPVQTVMRAPKAPTMNAAKFSAPDPMPPRSHQHEARYLIWAAKKA